MSCSTRSSTAILNVRAAIVILIGNGRSKAPRASVQNPAGTLTRTLNRPSASHRPSHWWTRRDYIEYETQDFWVYFGRQQALGRDYFKGMFENGLDTD